MIWLVVIREERAEGKEGKFLCCGGVREDFGFGGGEVCTAGLYGGTDHPGLLERCRTGDGCTSRTEIKKPRKKRGAFQSGIRESDRNSSTKEKLMTVVT